MSDDPKKYLATEVLSERRTVSYRTVSRALRVHVNAAKCLLWEFYEFQNGKTPGSVHATYLLSGVKKQQTQADTDGTKHKYDEDEPIPSSPPPFTSSMLEPGQHEAEEETAIPVRTITLVRDDSLEAVKEQFQSISSIHVYSLSAAPVQDLVTLTEIGRGLFVDVFAKQDPLVHNKTYGVIQTPDVRRRKGKRPIAPQGPAPKFQAVKEEQNPSRHDPSKPTKPSTPAAAAATATTTTKHDETASRPSSRDSTSTVESGQKKKPTIRRDASDLFKAFAKQSQQQKQPPKAAPVATVGGDAMDVDDEGESEDEALFLDTGTHKAATSATTAKRPGDASKEREDKAAKLRKMMDSDDEGEDGKAAAVAATEDQTKDHDGDADEKDEVAWSDSDTEKKASQQTAEQPTQPVQGQAGRRRGKRKVMKKRTTKDEDGYLVTKEEAVWESYSEDDMPKEPPRATPLPKKTVTTNGKGASQAGKGAASKSSGPPKKAGNIMSFFGKKN